MEVGPPKSPKDVVLEEHQNPAEPEEGDGGWAWAWAWNPPSLFASSFLINIGQI